MAVARNLLIAIVMGCVAASLYLAWVTTRLGGAADSMSRTVELYVDYACTCCEAWRLTLEEAGFRVIRGAELANEIRERFGVAANLSACHSAVTEGYLIEGHVPAGDIQVMLQDRPSAVGLVVPGMPKGSPGMEVESGAVPYDVLIVLNDGGVELFAQH